MIDQGTVLPSGKKVIKSGRFSHVECDKECHYLEDYSRATRSNIGACICLNDSDTKFTVKRTWRRWRKSHI